MKYFGKTGLACFMLLLASSGINACELPAHPNAAAMPVSITPRGGNEIPIAEAGGIVKLVSDTSNGKFYYMIPEGSKVKMKIVWDPLCHNSGATGSDLAYKKEQYDYLKDGHIAGVSPDTEVQPAGGYYFFPLSAMSEFFKVSGNRNDIEEAFGREMGVSTADKMVPDSAGLGPGSIYEATFSKASTNLVINLTGYRRTNENDPRYTDKPIKFKDEFKKRPILDEYDNTDSLNAALPGKHMNLNKGRVYILEDGKLKLHKFDNGNVGFSAAEIENSEDLIEYSDSGLEVRDISIKLKTPNYEDYKAYIADNSNNKRIHVEGINYDSANPIATGKNNGYFNVTFTTPSIDGNGYDDDNAVLKIRVNSPAAGYEMTNVYWVWKEQYYERVKEDKKYPVEGDDEVTEINCSDENYKVYKKKDGIKKYYCETMVTFNKSQDAFGYSGYKIYDDCGPISTTLKLTGNDDEKAFVEPEDKADKTTLKYEISLIDSNPFLDKEIVATSDEKKSFKDISQNKDKMDVTFYYNYPIYKYEAKTINKLEELKESPEGFGLLDFAQGNEGGSDSKFKTYNHKVQWYWKKATDVKITSLKNDEIYEDIVSGRVIGSKSTIEGTFTIDNPKPWHVSDSYKKPDFLESNFAVFAVLKDSAGNTHLTKVYDANSTEKELESANPTKFSNKSFAAYPVEGLSGEIPANLDEKTAPVLVDDIQSKEDSSAWDTSKWQKMSFIKSNDKTAPEIQIIVYDTRTNRYHIFGTSDNVAAGFNKFDTTSHKDYASEIDKVPYIGKNEAISNSYSYTTFENMENLYNAFLKVNDSNYKAVSTIEDPLNKNGFVCQKGSRLIFYVHAFDNISYEKPSEKYGISNLEVKLFDCDAGDTQGETKELKEGTYFENVFRQENYDKDGNLKSGMQPYKVIVTAKDGGLEPPAQPNTRKFELDIAVLGRTLDIRTLEEKRERVK